VDSSDEFGETGSIMRDRAKGVCVRDDSMPVRDQLTGNRVPTRGLGERAMNEDDGALHDRAFP